MWLALSCIAGALVLELAARVLVPPRTGLGPAFGPDSRPGVVYSPRQGESSIGGWESADRWAARIDAQGARVTPAGDEGCPRVVVYGDSYPFGWGVSDGEAYPALLGAPLESRIGCRPTVENRGVPGYHLGQSLARMQADGAHKAAVVVLHVEPFDGFPDFDFTSPLPLPRPLVARSRLLWIAQAAAIQRFDESIVKDAERTAAQTAVLHERLKALADWRNRDGTTVVLVVEPEVEEPTRRRLLAIGPSVNTERCDSEGDRLPENRHLSAAGHRCLADVLAPILAPLLADGP